MKPYWRILLFLVSINLVSCYQDHFYVQQDWIDRNFLASSWVKTPDPRQENPPTGERLAIKWYFPRRLFEQNLHLSLTLRFWDNTEETFSLAIEKRRDFRVFFFPAKSPAERKILTYQVLAISEEGDVVAKWEHPLWTPLIEVGD